MKVLTKLILSVACAISLVLVLLTTALFLPSLSASFYMKQYVQNGVFERTGLGEAELLPITRNIINYLRGTSDDLNVINGERFDLFDQREVDHMVDVREQFIFAANVRKVSFLMFAVTFFILTSHKKLKDTVLLLRLIRAVCGIVFILFGTFALFITLNFELAFDLFHVLMYSNDYWILNPNVHLLINLLPGMFFVNISVVIAVLFAVFLAVSFTAANLLLHLYKRGCCAK